MSTINSQIIQTLKTSPITASITASTVTQIRQEILDHMENTSNPHNVTVEQIGAMPYDKNIVSDADYTHTDNNFTDSHIEQIETLEKNSATKSELISGLNRKVDKIENHGLSTIKDISMHNNVMQIKDQNDNTTILFHTTPKNIIDDKNNSLIGNNHLSNKLLTDGYIDNNNNVIVTNPNIVNNTTDNIVNGLNAIHSSFFEIDGRGYWLYNITGLTKTTTLEELLPSIDSYPLITKQCKVDSKNTTIFGEDNTSLGSNSITSGKENLSSGSNSIVGGYQNILDSSDSFVAGSKNTLSSGCNAAIGARNKVNARQSFASGYNNTIAEDSYFSDAMGVGNINRGTATSSRGGYNLVGSEYSSVEGIDNIAGGDATFDGKHIADIDFYSDTKTYGIGNLVKRNGGVFKCLQNNTKGIIPNHSTNQEYWEIVEPVITTKYAKAAKASGEKCVAKHTGAFTHGYRLKSGRDYQTVLGKYNVENTSALLVVGAGSTEDTKQNALEVSQTETNINSRVNIKNGNTTGVLRETTGGEFVISGENSIRLRPTSTSSNKGGIVIKNGYIAPEMTSDLGTSGNGFKNLYLDGNINLDGNIYLNNKSVKSIFADKIGISINPTTYVMTISLKSPNGQTLSNAAVDLPLETMVIGATYSDGKLHLTLKNGETLDVDISDIISGLVPNSRTINGKELSTDITLTATDVGALPNTTPIPTKTSQLENDSNYLSEIPSEYITETELNSKGYLSSIPDEYITETELDSRGYLTSIPSDYVTNTDLNIKLSRKANTTDIPTDYVPNSLTINGKALTSDITLTANDVGAVTADYVESNGGKIDSISVNGVKQTIDESKNVNIVLPTANSTDNNVSIIMNPNFIVNQRGLTTFEDTGSAYYTVDRWKKESGLEGLIDSDGYYNLRILPTATQNAALIQYIESSDDFKGKTITISTKIINGDTPEEEFYSLTADIPEEDPDTLVTINIANVETSFGGITLFFDGSFYGIRYYFNPLTDGVVKNYTKIKYIKGEIGETATEFIPPKYKSELEKCYRHYLVIGEIYSTQGLTYPAELVHYTKYDKYNVLITMPKSALITECGLLSTKAKIRLNGVEEEVEIDSVSVKDRDNFDFQIVFSFRRNIDNSELIASADYKKYESIYITLPAIYINGEPRT